MVGHKNTLKGVENFVFDLDGTIWTWNSLKNGVKETISKLKSKDKNIYFLTDNAILSRKGFAKKLSEFGIETRKEQIITSGYVATKTFSEEGITKVYPIGESGLVDELEEEEIKISEKASNVLVSVDRNLTYWKIGKAIELINKGAKPWVTSKSSCWQVGKRKFLGAGAIANSIKEVTGEDFDLIGTPSDHVKKVFLDEFSLYPEQSILIGDEMSTDIYFGNKVGLKTGLVLGGETRKKDLRNSQGLEIPNIVFQDIKRILRKI